MSNKQGSPREGKSSSLRGFQKDISSFFHYVRPEGIRGDSSRRSPSAAEALRSASTA